MKVTAFNECTGEKIYELEMKECEAEHIADVSASYSNFDREKIFACYHEGCTAAATKIADLRPATVTEQARAVQEGRLFGYHRFDVSCPDHTPERCYTFCPQFDGQEAR